MIASENAEFGFPEVQDHGVPTHPGLIACKASAGRTPWSYLIGDRVDAATTRAKEMGLVGKVVPHDSLMDEAHKLANRLLGAAPLAQRATKEVAHGRAVPRSCRFGDDPVWWRDEKPVGRDEDA